MFNIIQPTIKHYINKHVLDKLPLKGKTRMRNTFVFVFYTLARIHTLQYTANTYMYIGRQSPLSFLTAVIIRTQTHTHTHIYILYYTCMYIV